ncbi:unnamed protein product [Lactuca virosa]|uniref:Ubiquitin-like protease family profile domain-containing protein n=1 Tax=Lactuca virosa TaxID=75947 RepID=A0AAU9M255_9ASTR|nr:unnamed protein product [Lactuca virosa]
MMDKASGEKTVTDVGDNNDRVDKSLKDTNNEETDFTAQKIRNLLTELNKAVIMKDKRKFEKESNVIRRRKCKVPNYEWSPFVDRLTRNEVVMDEKEFEFTRLKEFTLMLEMFIGNLDVKTKFSDVGLTGRYLIIDHVKRIGTVESRYRKIPRMLQWFFCNYLMTQNHPMHSELYSKEAKLMRVVWEVPDIGHECGLYLMRHMECYKGDLEGKWETRFKGIKHSDVAVLSRLRFVRNMSKQ